MGKTFIVWTFCGLYTSCNIKEMSLGECITKYVIERFSTKEFFFNRKYAFRAKAYDAEELTAEIGKGLAVFPVSKNQNMDEVKRYIDIGLFPVFMKAGDFREFRKIYGK